MAIVVKSNDKEGEYELSPLGNQQAVCAFVEDIGTHADEYMGVPNERHKVVICWELQAKMLKGDNLGRPFMMSKNYTHSLGTKSSLRKDLESWRGVGFTKQQLKGFDIEVLKGVNCLINVVEYDKQDGQKGRKIGSISPCMKGMGKLKVCNETPPEWIQKEREKSIEHQHMNNNTSYSQVPPLEDVGELPF